MTQRPNRWTEFIHFVSNINSGEENVREMTRRIQNNSNIYQTLKVTLWNRQLRNTKKTTHKVYFTPTVTKNVETCNLTKRNKSKFQSMNMKSLKNSVAYRPVAGQRPRNG
jgi:hypothetical protein